MAALHRLTNWLCLGLAPTYSRSHFYIELLEGGGKNLFMIRAGPKGSIHFDAYSDVSLAALSLSLSLSLHVLRHPAMAGVT